MRYAHLSQTERYQIYTLMKANHSLKEIALLLNRSGSTISREVKRNRGSRGYRPCQAQSLSTRRSLNSRNALTISPLLWEKAKQYIHEQYSPEQIAGILPISHETVYQRIYADKANKGMLYQHLRCHKKRRKRYASGRDRRGQIRNRRSIATRPACVQAKSRIGDWEGDTIIGAAHQQAIVSLVERKSGYVLLAKVKRKTADAVEKAVTQLFLPFAKLVKTITFDNGKEFANHQTIDRMIGSTSYFADPFASWQRGANENCNGLVRQYIPKKRALSTVSDQEITMIQHKLNHRPRKRLNFLTPHTVFHEAFKLIALRA